MLGDVGRLAKQVITAFVQQPPTAPRTGGLDALLLIGLLLVVAVVGVLRWAVKRRSS